MGEQSKSVISLSELEKLIFESSHEEYSFRGKILTGTLYVETTLTQILSLFMTPEDEQYIFQEYVAPQLSFNDKIIIFQKILQLPTSFKTTGNNVELINNLQSKRIQK